MFLLFVVIFWKLNSCLCWCLVRCKRCWGGWSIARPCSPPSSSWRRSIPIGQLLSTRLEWRWDFVFGEFLISLQVLCMWYSIKISISISISQYRCRFFACGTISQCNSTTRWTCSAKYWSVSSHHGHFRYFWKIAKKTDYEIFPPIVGLGPRSSAANFWPQLEIGGNRDEGVGSVNSDLTEVAVRINLSKYEKIDDPSKMIFFTGREKQPTKHGRTFEGNLRSKSFQSRPRIPD